MSTNHSEPRAQTAVQVFMMCKIDFTRKPKHTTLSFLNTSPCQSRLAQTLQTRGPLLMSQRYVLRRVRVKMLGRHQQTLSRARATLCSRRRKTSEEGRVCGSEEPTC
jgi:hypothetical protein